MKQKTVLYKELKEAIKTWITSGKYKVGEQLPTERSLVKCLNVSRITVLGALKELERDGYIVRLQGKGTYVKSDKPAVAVPLVGTKKTTISFGINGYNEYKYFYSYLVSVFESENPGLTVKLMSVPMSARLAECPYMVRLMSGDLPLVGEFYMHADYAALNGLYPLDAFPDFREIVSRIPEKLKIVTNNLDNEPHHHAIPVCYSPRFLMVNTEIADEIGISVENGPESMSVLSDWIEAFARYGKNKDVFPAALDCSLHHDAAISYLPYIWTFTGYRKARSKEDFIDLLSSSPGWMGYILDVLKTMLCQGIAASNLEALFLLGKSGMLLSTNTVVFRLACSIQPGFELKSFLIPPLVEGNRPVTTCGDMSVGIFRSAIRDESELAGAWKWIKFLLKPEIQAMRADAHGVLPVFSGIALPWLSEYNESTVRKAMEFSEPQYDFKDIRKIYAILVREIHHAAASSRSPGKAIETAVRKIKDNIY
jgi:DNA-binding transcriptional regulator YhcF (GntR family)